MNVAAPARRRRFIWRSFIGPVPCGKFSLLEFVLTQCFFTGFFNFGLGHDDASF